MTNKILTIIPVRLASTRLPNKPLADICGKTMIQRVYEQAVKANLGEVLIACDGEEIAREVKKFGGNYIITDPDLPSGTDRIYQALQKFGKDDFEVIFNLQGDLPNIDPEIIKLIANCALNSDADIVTAASIISDKAQIIDPNVVKIALTLDEEKSGRALYFSRASIPYSRGTYGQYYHHIGLYAYKKQALEKFVNLKPSNLEITEGLEQLRALENNMKISVKIVNSQPLSVDTKEDLDVAIKIISL